VVLSAVPKTPVTISYAVVNGTPAKGSFTFLPGETTGILPIVTGSSGNVEVSITGEAGASLGTNRSLEYTITQ
jgi:hypothetical protein